MSSSSASWRPQTIFASDPALRERDQRLESLKMTVGRLAHDFNNFLVPLLGYVTLIKEELSQSSPATHYANTMEGAARKSEAHLDTILMAVRPQRRFNPKLIAYDELIHTQLAEFRDKLPANSQVLIESKVEPFSSYGDEQQIILVIQALLKNAHFALATGGMLQVELSRQTLAEEKLAQLNVRDRSVCKIVFKDHGFGMPQSVLQRAFEPFFTTRAVAQAPGLGLTLVHSVVQLHGGQVLLESVEDQGTTVTIYLPELKSPPETSRMPRSKTDAIAEASKKTASKILLVEDDPLVREVIKTCLSRTQKEIHVAQDGEEGLKFFKRYQPEWALVISDVTMPRMSGVDLYKAIKDLEPEMRVILVSGDADPSFGGAFSADEERPLLIKKPFTLKSFYDVVKTHLAENG
ncbi:MAG: response regulator [Verrucomicrobiota bacterium]|nr:response regulator [Verrucomicrobiota bacterium]